MKITLHRAEESKNTLVEIATSKSKILLDGGISLDENAVLLLPELQAQYSFSEVDAIFLSHYNTDHITMARGLLTKPKVYCGKLAGQMATAAEAHKAKTPFHFAGYYANGVAIAAGDITVTPFLVDDLFHEGYLLLIEGDGKRVIYTGDYRANGRKSFEEMLAALPEKVDTLLCENGVLTDADTNPITERDLEQQAAALIGATKGPVFVLHSAVHFDRAETFSHVARRNKRLLLEDLYMAEIAVAAGRAMPNPASWTGVRTYLTTGYKPEHFRYKRFAALPSVSKTDIATQKFIMCIRPSMKKYLKTLSQELRFKHGIMLNALPDDSADNADAMEYLAFAAKKGLTVHRLRCSGHADAVAVKKLIEAVKPTRIMPLARKNARWFAQQYPKLEIVTQDKSEC